MSDFLGRLAERTLGHGAVVRPRLAPLFAGDGAALAAGPSMAAEADDAGRFSSPVERAQEPPSAPSRPDRAAPITAASPPPVAEFGADEVAATPPTAVNHPVDVRALTTARHSSVGRDVALHGSDLADSEPGLSTPPRGDRMAQVAGDARPLERRTPNGPVTFEPLVARPERGPSGTASIAATNEPRAVSRAEPAIQVTIGRIDVRAVQPPPPARPRPGRPPAPQLTVDDYVKQRREGVR
jgi:hypothetical protein